MEATLAVPADDQRYVHLMDDRIHVETVAISPGYMRVAASGVAGTGSDGNRHGDQIHDAIEIAMRDSPRGILIDLRQLDYRFGNYICTAVLGSGFPRKRMCVLAQGESLRALRELWDSSGFDIVLPLFDDELAAIDYISR